MQGSVLCLYGQTDFHTDYVRLTQIDISIPEHQPVLTRKGFLSYFFLDFHFWAYPSRICRMDFPIFT